MTALAFREKPIKAVPQWNGDELEVVLVPNVQRMLKCRKVSIPERHFWLYSREHNPLHGLNIARIAEVVYQLFNIGGVVTKEKMVAIAMEIENGIQDAMLMRPKADPVSLQIGELGFTDASGKRHVRPLYDHEVPAEDVDVTGIVHVVDDGRGGLT
jgi:hypothetical protein